MKTCSKCGNKHYALCLTHYRHEYLKYKTSRYYDKNPDKYLAAVKMRSGKRSLKSCQSRISSRVKYSRNMTGDVRRMLSRGRDVGFIAVVLGIPVSAVQAIVGLIHGSDNVSEGATPC